MNTLDIPLGQIARSLPGATAIFHHYQLDFCCGGNETLRNAATKQQLDAEAIAAELSKLADIEQPEQAFTDTADEELIEYILTRYHDVHRQQLPELIRLARRVELVHGGRPECPAGLAHHLEKMQVELEEHMRKEEQILFPMITRGMKTVARQPVAVMRHEHDDHGETLKGLEKLTNGITLPKGACNTWRALYLGLEDLRKDLMDHIHLENNILFNRIDGR